MLIGWDAADWQMVRPLMDRGWMPSLKQVIERGVWGNMATLRPVLSPMLWNTIATGRRPEGHGIHGFTEPRPDGSGVRPVMSTSRRCKALWNILTQSDMRSIVVGWYASHPAEPINGVCVSNQFEQVTAKAGEPWPVPRGAVHPPEMTDRLAQFRVHPSELDATAILPFIPRAAQIDSENNQRVGKLATMLAQTASVHTVATDLLQNQQWDFAAVYYEGIDRFGHEFMHFHPPKMDAGSQEDFELYREVMTGCYRFHDMMLDKLLGLADQDTAVILISDHGYYNDHLRPPDPEKAGPVEWHRPFGIVAACGAGFKRGEQLYGASLMDVTPTVLRILGLPVGADMRGRPWVEVFDRPLESDRVLSWEQIEGDCGMHPPDARVDPVAEQQAMQQLIELGYIDAPGEDVQKNIEGTIASNQLNLALSMIDANRPAPAILLLEELLESGYEQTTVKMQLAVCHMMMNHNDQARTIVDELLASKDAAPRAHVLSATLDLAAGNWERALESLKRAEEKQPRLPGLYQRMGRVYLHAKKWDEADRVFRKAMEIDPDNAVAFDGLAEVCLGRKEYDRAVDYALEAVGLIHSFPRAHLHLGLALEGIGQRERAIEAIELAVRQSTLFAEAHQALARLHGAVGDPAKAADHLVKAGDARQRMNTAMK